MTITETVALQPVPVDEDFAALLRSHPLPDGVQDADVSQSDLATAFGVSVNTVSKWVKHMGMPCVQEGDSGRAYVFRLSHCWAWRQSREAERRARETHAQRQIERLQASFLGVDLDQHSAATLDPKARRDMAQADIAWNQAARLRRELIDASEVRDLFETVMTTVRDSMDGLSDRLGRELSLTPTQEAAVQRASHDCLRAMMQRFEDAGIRASDEPIEAMDPWAR